MHINKAESIITDEEGITIKSGDIVVKLSWNVIDEIADASEPHYHGQMLEYAAMLPGLQQLKSDKLN